jgi:hypothetical protein
MKLLKMKVRVTTELLDLGDIEPKEAKGIIVTQLELSLQHIHKIILSYPPIHV